MKVFNLIIIGICIGLSISYFKLRRHDDPVPRNGDFTLEGQSNTFTDCQFGASDSTKQLSNVQLESEGEAFFKAVHRIEHSKVKVDTVFRLSGGKFRVTHDPDRPFTEVRGDAIERVIR